MKYNLFMGAADFLKKYFPEGIPEKDISPYIYKGLHFIRFTHDYRHILRGTVLWENGIIYGYPRIRRVLHLERGINRHLKEKFYAEEKVDGYNVRVAGIDGEPVAFTRGGLICPFTTDRLPDFIDPAFFIKHPGYTLCGEVVGPENPYNTEVIPYIKEDVLFLCFDVTDEKGALMPIEEKYGIFEMEGINTVRRWGPFEAKDIKTLKDLILSLDAEGREGIVLKPLKPEEKTLKYVTLSSCLRDIEATATLMAELPAGFYTQRIMRAFFFAHEFGIALSEDYLLRSAKALYGENQKLLKEIEEGEGIKEFFTIRVKRRNAIDELMRHLRSLGVAVQLQSVEKTDGYYRARFYRTYGKGTKELRRRLRGHGFFD